MSNPTPPQNPDETPDAAADQSTLAYPAADAQPTEVYPPAPEQPTQAYPPVPDGPAPGYPPAVDAYGQPAAYPPPVYPVATAPKAPDTRPKTFGWVSLGLAVAGLVLVLVAFIPLLWVSLVLALLGGVLLLGGLIFGIVTLANKKQGGKGLGIGAIIVSVLGGGAWIGALVWALVLIGLSASSNLPDILVPSPAPSAEISEAPATGDGTTDGESTDDTTAGVYDEEAYLAQVRPGLVALFQEIDPSVTESDLDLIFNDDSLIATGQGVLLAGEAGRQAMISGLAENSGDTFSEEQAIRFYDTILAAAQAHLVE